VAIASNAPSEFDPNAVVSIVLKYEGEEIVVGSLSVPVGNILVPHNSIGSMLA
jgi:hypothetical protein